MYFVLHTTTIIVPERLTLFKYIILIDRLVVYYLGDKDSLARCGCYGSQQVSNDGVATVFMYFQSYVSISKLTICHTKFVNSSCTVYNEAIILHF